MTVFIIIFITLSLMGSALWIMPSKQDRQRMELRLHARKKSLTVQLTSIDLPDKWDKSKNKQKVCSYSLYRNKPLKGKGSIWILPYEVWKYNELTDGWWSSQALSLEVDVLELLKKCRADDHGIFINSQGVFFYWQERGTLEKVDDIASLLEKLESITFFPQD